MLPAIVAAIAAVAISAAFSPSAAAQPLSINSMTKGPADDVMIDGRQRVLYTFDDDFYDRSSCQGGCAEQWPPFEPQRGEFSGAGFAIVQRPDGRRQWSYVGSPLYYSARDKNPYDLRGDGVDGLWHYARLPGDND